MRDLGPKARPSRLPVAHLAFPSITKSTGNGQAAEGGSAGQGGQAIRETDERERQREKVSDCRAASISPLLTSRKPTVLPAPVMESLTTASL